MVSYKTLSHCLQKVYIILLNLLTNWYERQIEIFVNAYISLQNKHLKTDTLSSIVLKSESISELKMKISNDINTCKKQLKMIYTMFMEMGLNQESAEECVRLLIETESIPKNYIRTLCFLWSKYKVYDRMQDDLFNAPLIIQQNKEHIYNLFRFQLKPLIGIHEEKDIVLKEYCKHQADISKSIELAYLTETSQLFLNTNSAQLLWCNKEGNTEPPSMKSPHQIKFEFSKDGNFIQESTKEQVGQEPILNSE